MTHQTYRLGPFKNRVVTAGFQATLVPENFTATCGITMQGPVGSTFFVDWGNGSPVEYERSTNATAVPTGNIIVTSEACNYFQATTNTYLTCAMTGCGQLTSMDSSFNTRTKFTSITMDDTSNVTNWRQAFRQTTNLATCNVTDFSGAVLGSAGFQCNAAFQLSGIASLGAIVVSGDCNQMFSNSGILAIDSSADFSAITEADQMFLNSDIVTFPAMDMSDCVNFDSMFRDCSDLETVGALITGEAADSVDYDAMFLNCVSLTSIAAIDTTNTSSTSLSMFGNCGALTSPNGSEQADLADFNGADFN